MIDNTLLGYSVLNTLNEQGMDIIDTYVPLCCYCISKNATNEYVTREQLVSWLDKEYGLSHVTLGAAESFLVRMKGKFVKKDKGQYIIISDAVHLEAEKIQDDNIYSELNNLFQEIIKFAQKQYDKSFSIEEIEKGLMSFFEKFAKYFVLDVTSLKNDLKDKRVKGEIGEGAKALRYIISAFILYAYKQQLTLVNVLERLARGHAIASIISFDQLNNCVGKMDGVLIAIDAPLLYNLLALNGLENQKLTEELLTILKDKGCEFCIFHEHHEEVINTLQDAQWRIGTHNYNYLKSSRVLKFAIRNKLTASYIQTKISQVEDVLKQYSISIKEAPTTSYYLNINQQQLKNNIAQHYLKDREELESHEIDLINTDVDVISYIYQLRGRTTATSLKGCKALLITNNRVVAKASSKHGLSPVNHSIPVCCTDVFLSTILWVNYPEANENLNKMILMSQCYSNTILADNLLRKFYNEAKQLNEEHRITNEQMTQLFSSQLILSLLEKKTLNDDDLYTDTTTDEIIRDFQEQQGFTLMLNETSIDQLAHKLASFFYGLVWVLLAAAFLWVKYVNPIDLPMCVKIIYWILAGITTLWGICVWAHLIKDKDSIIYFMERKFKKIIYEYGKKSLAKQKQ